jgi:flavin reductase (DIM6/NTAB) family NADH-FMN oxidoreductase RutF
LPGVIHEENPFAVPDGERDPVRRFRGRLAAPVTVVTAGRETHRTGLAVSSLMVADGTPGRILFLCGRNADLGDVIESSGGFVVHVLGAGDEALSDRFAGVRPSPGGLFTGLEVAEGARGPVITSIPTRAVCALTTLSDAGWYLLVEGAIEEIALGDPGEPLLRFRGQYRGIEAGDR